MCTSLSKSEFMLVGDVRRVIELASIFGCKVGQLPMTFGIAIGFQI
jgi:hypothetical protein